MACITPNVSISGFSIELIDANITFNVQDTFGNSVANAIVTIQCPGFQINGETDDTGCFQAIIPPGAICDLHIEAECLFDNDQKFEVIDIADLVDPMKNFVMKVVDGTDQAISGAQVDIVSDLQNITGTTNGNGIFEGEYAENYVNSLTVSKSGFQNYECLDIESFIKIECGRTGFIVVPIIVLSA